MKFNFNIFKKYKNNLFEINKAKLTTGSKFMLLVFVLVMFVVIGIGVDIQRDSVKSIYKEFGSSCTSLINNSG